MGKGAAIGGVHQKMVTGRKCRDIHIKQKLPEKPGVFFLMDRALQLLDQ
jgi:hypothetical protein